MPVKGPGSASGPQRKSKPKRSVGKAIQNARPAPKPKPKPGVRSTGKVIQKAGGRSVGPAIKKTVNKGRKPGPYRDRMVTSKTSKTTGKKPGPHRTGYVLSTEDFKRAERRNVIRRRAKASLAASVAVPKGKPLRKVPEAKSPIDAAVELSPIGGAKRARRALMTAVSTGDPVKTVKVSLGAKPPKETRALERTAVKQAKKELSGQGGIAKASQKVGDRIVEKGVGVQTGGGPAGAIANKQKKGMGRAAAARPYRIKDAEIAANFIKDAVNFPAQAVPSLYVPAAAGVEAAKGDTKRAKQLAKDVQENDPVYAAGEAAVKAASGDSEGAKKSLKRAGKIAKEHPGFTALEVYGLKGAIGRGGGRTVRVTGKVLESAGAKSAGKRVYKVGSTAGRAPAVKRGTSLREERPYSPDIITKAAQVAKDRRTQKRVRNLERKAKKVRKANPDRARELRQKAYDIDPTQMKPKQIKRRVDERVAVNETVRRQERAEATEAAAEALKPVRKRGGAATALVTQGITKASKADLRKYQQALADEFDNLDNAGKRANKQLREQIGKVLDDRKVNMGAVERAARDYAKLSQKQQRQLVERGLLDADQADRAAVIPYAVRNMGAKFDGDRLAAPDGSELSTTAIKKHMRDNGVDEVAFVTQAPNQRGGKNFFINSDREPSINNGRRTGAATVKGTFDADPEVLVEQVAANQGRVSAANGFRAYINEFAVKGDKTGKVKAYASYKHAQKAARELASDADGDPVPGAAYRPVRLRPFGGSDRQLEQMFRDFEKYDAKSQQRILKALDSALEGEDGPGPWTLVPEEAATRMQEHLRVLGANGGGKTLQAVNQAFRTTVLSTSPAWLTGNVVEGVGRATVAKAGPRSFVTGRRVLKQLRKTDPEAYNELAARAVGGAHYSMVRRSARHVDPTQFDQGGLKTFWKAVGAARRTPGPKHVADAWRAYTGLIFDKVNGSIERNVSTAMFGKAVRDRLMDDRLLQSSRRAVDDAARGLRGTEAQIRLARDVERMYGKYQAFSPTGRKYIANYTPFVAWTLNAYRFVYDVLPRDHPALTALIVSMEMATEEWRKDKGLDLFIKGQVPGFLQGSVPTKDGGWVRASRYTPFGAFGDPLGTLAGAVLPQFSGTLDAMEGRSWQGYKLKTEGTDKQLEGRAKTAAQAFAEATVPVVGVGRRVAEDGPGTLNPFRTVKSKQKPREKKRKARRKKSAYSSYGSASGY